jgi:hypothetical protein
MRGAKALRQLLGIVFALSMMMAALRGDAATAADWGIALALIVCSEIEHP